MLDQNEELELSVVQTGTDLPRKLGRSRLENPKRPRRARKKTEEEIWKENLDALSEDRRSELLALADEHWMCEQMMKDIAWLHLGYGVAGEDRFYPDLCFVDIKAHIAQSGGLIAEYPKKEKDMEESYQLYGLLTKICAPDFKRFAYQVAEWCHKHPEEVSDREVEIECVMVSGWKPQPQSVRSAKSIQAFDEANTSHQEKDRRQSAEQEKKWLKSIDEGTLIQTFGVPHV